MGIISLVSTGIPDLLPMRGRSHDIPHLSEIIHYLCITNGHYALQSDPDMTRMQLGQAFEFSLLQRYTLHEPNRFIRPAEIRRDGIAMNLDAVDIRIPSIDDWKLTWMSSNEDPNGLKFWRLWTQVMCYAYPLDIHTVKLHACHVNGVGRSPVMNEWRMDCERDEIEARWDLIYSTSRSRAFLDWWHKQREQKETNK
jgi:hypothetical protein